MIFDAPENPVFSGVFINNLLICPSRINKESKNPLIITDLSENPKNTAFFWTFFKLVNPPLPLS